LLEVSGSVTAAFIASLLKGKSVEEAHCKAVEVSAFVCTRKGAMPTLPREIVEG
jgi:fructokinase